MTDGLLLIHAFPLDARMWEPQLAAFSDALPVVAPHLPGFGGSASAGDVMTMGSAADRCIAELDRAGVDRAVVCGLSMGGYVALELWRRAPERIVGLALANTKSTADTEEAVAGRHALADRLRSEGNAFLVASPPPLLSEGADDALWGRVKDLIADQPATSIAAAALGMAERPDSTPDLPGVGVPATVITGTGDTLIPSDATAPMAGEIPDGELVTLEGAGHLSNLEAPGAFDEAIRELLVRCGVGS
jgi:3-oxoadipate enol-lactonase